MAHAPNHPRNLSTRRDYGGSIRRAPPVLGEHTFEVLKEYGYAQGDLEALARDGVIVQHAQGASA